ncbi:hypothetical protein EKK58_02455 [Candidatus Dependentiae bacterium]|nr:MAG: hypothetical protein EKK58_02455 [Candidatus Dependentiae bacterium]
MKKILYHLSFLFFIHITNTAQCNFAKFFSYKKIFNKLCGLIIAAPFYEIAIQKIKNHLLLKTIKKSNKISRELDTQLDIYNPKLHTEEEKKSMYNAYIEFHYEIKKKLYAIQNSAPQKTIREHYKNTKTTAYEINKMYSKAINCLKTTKEKRSLAEHNRCLSLWKDNNN